MPYGKIASSFLLCSSFFRSSFQLPLSSVAKTHTVFQVNLAGSGFHFVTSTLSENFTPRIEYSSTVGQIFRKSCTMTLRTICSLKHNYFCSKNNNILWYVHSSKVGKYKTI